MKYTVTDRKNQVEAFLHSFHAIRHRLLTGGYLLSAKNQIPNSQWMALRVVRQHEGIGVKELSRLLGISSSAATQLVDNLVKKGYLVREQNAEDRRALNIKLTEKTKKLIDTANSRVIGKIYSALEVLTDEELRQYCDMSKKVADKILEQ
jgi:DNA-binding MarR family transcriptional regulator